MPLSLVAGNRGCHKVHVATVGTEYIISDPREGSSIYGYHAFHAASYDQ